MPLMEDDIDIVAKVFLSSAAINDIAIKGKKGKNVGIKEWLQYSIKSRVRFSV